MARRKTRTQPTPILSGYGLPKRKMRFDNEVPITDLTIPEQLDDGCGKSTEGLRRYDKQATEAMTESMKKFGFIEPIIASGDGVIIHGVHRFLVARDVLKQATVPVLYVDDWDEDTVTSQFYNLMTNKMNDWSTWMSSAIDEVLKKVDGGIGRKVVQGDDATFVVVPDESGELRDMARILGMFVNVIPKTLCASPANLLELAKMRIRSLGKRYQYNDEQLLFIGSLEEEVNESRRRAIENGHDLNVEQKKKQNDAVVKQDMERGKVVARVDLLHSMGLPNYEIARIVGIPENSNNQRRKSRAEGISAKVADDMSVEKAIWQTERRNFDPTTTYGWWIEKIFSSRDEALHDPEVQELLDKLEPLRKPFTLKTDEDGLQPPARKLDLKDRKTRELFDRTVDLIDSKVNAGVSADDDQYVDRAFIEDWVAWPEALKFYANQCFKYVLEQDAKKHPIKTKHKTPMDVKLTDQTNGKICSKVNWLEIYWLDRIHDGKIVLPDLPSFDFDSIGSKNESGDDTLKRLRKEAEDKQEEEIRPLRAKSDKEAEAIYDSSTPHEFNQMLVDIRAKYKKGPVNLFNSAQSKQRAEDAGKPADDKTVEDPSEEKEAD